MKLTNLKLPGEGNYFMQEAMNVLRTNIQFCGRDVKVIAITSCFANEGKSVISLMIGKSLSELGKKVLVIDADMRNSVMAGRNSDSRNVQGLSEVLTGLEAFDNIVYTTQYENLDVLFSGQYPPNPVELLNGQYFDQLLTEQKEHYDYIIVDTPPLGMVIDAAVISAKCDSAIVIIGKKDVKYRMAQDVVEQLKKSGCKVLGVVLNNSNTKHKGYYYKGKYAYRHKYYAGHQTAENNDQQS